MSKKVRSIILLVIAVCMITTPAVMASSVIPSKYALS